MRSILVCLMVVVAGVYVAVRLLPHGEAQAQSGPQLPVQQVQSVAIDHPAPIGDSRGLPLADLRALLETRAGDSLDDAKLARDRAALEDELEARGYRAAKVAAPTVTYGKRGGAYVVFDVHKGPMFHIRSVTISGPGERDAKVVTLVAGDEAIGSRIARARQTLAESIERRTGTSAVELTVRDDPAAAAVDVELGTR